MERKGRTNGIIRDISLVRLRARASPPCQPYYSSFLYAVALAKPFPGYQEAFKPLSFCEQYVTLMSPSRQFLFFKRSRIKGHSSVRFDVLDLLILLFHNAFQLARVFAQTKAEFSRGIVFRVVLYKKLQRSTGTFRR